MSGVEQEKSIFMSGEEEEKSIFLTVGTTSFDELVSSATEPQFLRVSLSV